MIYNHSLHYSAFNSIFTTRTGDYNEGQMDCYLFQWFTKHQWKNSIAYEIQWQVSNAMNIYVDWLVQEM